MSRLCPWYFVVIEESDGTDIVRFIHIERPLEPVDFTIPNESRWSDWWVANQSPEPRPLDQAPTWARRRLERFLEQRGSTVRGDIWNAMAERR